MADDLEERTSDFVHALAASETDVANISADRTEDAMVVTCALLDPDDPDLVRDVAEEHSLNTVKTPEKDRDKMAVGRNR